MNYIFRSGGEKNSRENPNKQEAVYETMLSINQEMENWIRQHPEQWLWIHRRFDKSEYK